MDLIYSNAALHWLPVHQALIPVMHGLKSLGDKGFGGVSSENGMHQRFWDERFQEEYSTSTMSAYPRPADGTTLLQLTHLFLVVTKA